MARKAKSKTPEAPSKAFQTYKRTPHEVFEQISEIPEGDRAKFLKDNSGFALVTILQGAFSPKIVLDIPRGAPPYKKDENPPDYSLTRVDNSIKILGTMVKGSKNSPVVKERNFIALLESIHYKDAEIIIAMKDKELQKLYPIITSELVSQAFPGLL